jgi:hypothetical protein
MSKKKITRRNFIDKTTTGLIGAAVASGTSLSGSSGKALSISSAKPGSHSQNTFTGNDFTKEVLNILPTENPYDYHKKLSEGPVHEPRRNFTAVPRNGEMSLSQNDWKLVWNTGSSCVLQNAVQDFQDYMDKSMGVRIEVDGRDSIERWQNLSQSIIVGTCDQMPECGISLKGPKDYEIVVSHERVIICGYDERGAMYGLYNVEARMNLREAPFLPLDLKTVRHSLYDVRLVHSWMGWMEWPDSVLSHLAHDGFDGIFASALANPNGDRTTAESSTDFYARILFRIRKQDPARMRDLINRAARFGIKVYTQIIYQYMGTSESEEELRRLVHGIVKEFPDIHGYILLTEGFWYKKWGGGYGASKAYLEDWARNWSRAVRIVAEECHKVNPVIEILPWEYNINFQPQNVEMKRYFVRQLPESTIPLLTWENGKSFEIDGMQGFLTDYAISQVGPAEVTQAQIAEAHQRGMKIYSNADTFVCGAQLQTIPYHPFPYQWYERYKALEEFGVKGTLESWTTGYNPNFVTKLRAWYCWSDAPMLEELLDAFASNIFGIEGKEMVLKAWDLFSQAIRLVPDTGPTMGTSNSIGNPLFFKEPFARTATFRHSWIDQDFWMGYLGGEINPFWPFTVSRLVLYPDFSNKVNQAENYARSASGVQVGNDVAVLPAFLKRLRQASVKMEEGLNHYRAAALCSPESKRIQALHEVLIAEHIQCMILSNHAILEFEDLRFQLAAENDHQKASIILDSMENIVREEISRTEFSLLSVTRDSRLGFQQECDYVYTPYSLREKLGVLHETLETQIPLARKIIC